MSLAAFPAKAFHITGFFMVFILLKLRLERNR